MIHKVILMSLISTLPLLCLNLHAADSEYSEGWKNISNESFHSRFRVKGDIFIVDSTGKKLLSPTTDTREWQLGSKGDQIENTWSVAAKGFNEIAVKHVWKLNKDNSIDVTIQQFDRADRNEGDLKKYTYGKLIREEHFTIDNFAPISWIAESGKNHRVILRFSPEVLAVGDTESMDRIRIGGDRRSFIVTDNQGYLWSDNVRFGGILAGLTSHRGSFIISFYPFSGAKALGAAMGKTIELNLTEDLSVKISSDTDVVPGEMRVKVYGKYLPNIKTPAPNSRISYGHRSLNDFPKELR